MNNAANFEHRAGSSRSQHEGEPSFALCDRPSRTRDNSQRQLPTDHDYAVPTREYQTDQSSLNLPRLLLALSSRRSKNTHRLHRVDTVTPYQDISPGQSGLCPVSRLSCRVFEHLPVSQKLSRSNTTIWSSAWFQARSWTRRKWGLRGNLASLLEQLGAVARSAEGGGFIYR
jgi:hypothetical protein